MTLGPATRLSAAALVLHRDDRVLLGARMSDLVIERRAAARTLSFEHDGTPGPLGLVGGAKGGAAG